MIEKPESTPTCFGDLETVFPMGADDLRHSPLTCMECPMKTDCLRQAMSGKAGSLLREESVDRAYQAGVIGFFDRWSRKKALYLERKK
jgi:hypothetical protein